MATAPKKAAAKSKSAAPAAAADRNMPLNIEAMLAQESQTVKDLISSTSGDKIKCGRNGSITLPDGTEVDELECVVLAFVSANMYYDRPYDKDAIIPPACFAINPVPSLLTPNPKAPAAQGSSCSTCSMNQFGSAANGKSKACGNRRLVAVTTLDGEGEIFTVSVPPSGIRGFDAYVARLSAKLQTVTVGVLTKLTVNSNSDYGVPEFDVIRKLDQNELTEMVPMREEAMARLTAEPDVSGYEPPAPRRNARR